MAEHKLDCCVVRDLLPAYLESLTEPETTAQVKAHLAECPGCQKTAEDMKAAVPVEKAPKRALRFLKRVKRTRLIAAALSAVLSAGAASEAAAAVSPADAHPASASMAAANNKATFFILKAPFCA